MADPPVTGPTSPYTLPPLPKRLRSAGVSKSVEVATNAIRENQGLSSGASIGKPLPQSHIQRLKSSLYAAAREVSKTFDGVMAFARTGEWRCLGDLMKGPFSKFMSRETYCTDLKNADGKYKTAEEIRNLHHQVFEKDISRQATQINEKQYGMCSAEEGRARLPEVSTRIEHALATVLKDRAGFTPQVIQRLRYELEGLMNQASFVLDADFFSKYTIPSEKKTASGVTCVSHFTDEVGTLDQRTKLKNELKQIVNDHGATLRYNMQIEKDRITVTCMRDMIHLASDRCIGDDAQKVTFKIDLNKMKPEDLLLSKGCVKVTNEFHGVREKRSEITWVV